MYIIIIYIIIYNNHTTYNIYTKMHICRLEIIVIIPYSQDIVGLPVTLQRGQPKCCRSISVLLYIKIKVLTKYMVLVKIPSLVVEFYKF